MNSVPVALNEVHHGVVKKSVAAGAVEGDPRDLPHPIVGNENLDGAFDVQAIGFVGVRRCDATAEGTRDSIDAIVIAARANVARSASVVAVVLGVALCLGRSGG